MYDLNVDSPEKVSAVLRDAADAYYQSAAELNTAWQDDNAGRVWANIAAELERAANRIDKLT